MRVVRDYAELTAHESSVIMVSAAWFGFEPDRAAWFQNAESIYYEQGLIAKYRHDPSSVPAVGWWTGWLSINYVTEEEAILMGNALGRSAAWYEAHPGETPSWLEPFPDWDWKSIKKLVESPDLLDTLSTVRSFLTGGAFESETRKSPWAHVLWR